MNYTVILREKSVLGSLSTLLLLLLMLPDLRLPDDVDGGGGGAAAAGRDGGGGGDGPTEVAWQEGALHLQIQNKSASEFLPPPTFQVPGPVVARQHSGQYPGTLPWAAEPWDDISKKKNGMVY